MILDEKNREKLINLVKQDLKENSYNKNTEALLKELESMKSEETVMMTRDEVKYAVDITKIFEETGLLNIKENKINKEELDNVKKLMKKILELEKLKKNLYNSIKNNIDDYETYKSQLDAFCINVGELFLEMSNEIIKVI